MMEGFWARGLRCPLPWVLRVVAIMMMTMTTMMVMHWKVSCQGDHAKSGPRGRALLMNWAHCKRAPCCKRPCPCLGAMHKAASAVAVAVVLTAAFTAEGTAAVKTAGAACEPHRAQTHHASEVQTASLWLFSPVPASTSKNLTMARHLLARIRSTCCRCLHQPQQPQRLRGTPLNSDPLWCERAAAICRCTAVRVIAYRRCRSRFV